MADVRGTLHVRFGGGYVSAGIRSASITEEINAAARAEVEIDVEALSSAVADFRPQVVVEDGAERTFTGWVGKAEIANGLVRVSMSNGNQLEESRIDHLAISNGITPEEMVWSIGRLAGFPEDSLHIGGFKRVADRFHVAMPVTGLALEGDRRFGSVRLTPDAASIRGALGFVSDAAWVEEFLAPGAWAIAAVDAGTLFDAEQAGAQLIVGTLDRLTVEAQYSFALSPGGELLPFDRADLFADPRAVRVALVRAATKSGRAWVRTLNDLSRSQPLATRRVELTSPPVGEHVQYDEAIRAWRHALGRFDRVAAASAISEAIEFYAAGAEPALGFSTDDMKALRSALRRATGKDGSPLVLTTEQRQRVDDVLGYLNEPSLKMRLRAALAADGVPFTEDEIKALWRARTARNYFVHGKSREEPDENDLDLARAFVNRLLVWWGRSARIGRVGS